MSELLFGAAKDKGGWMSVRACEVKITNTEMVEIFMEIFEVHENGAKGLSFSAALKITDAAMINILNANDWLIKSSKQPLLEKLILIRASILNASKSGYEHYGIETC